MFGSSLLCGALALTGAVRAQDLPQLKLPWGTWEAQKYEPDPNIYFFKNVRFGAQPARFSAPSFPNWGDDVLQRDNRSIACNQVDITRLENPPGGKNPLGIPDKTNLFETEDCLFLDIYVPVNAFHDVKPLPVIVWIYGGGFVYGSKENGSVLYTGQSMLSASNYTTIFVAGNYRLGAYGWLAGNYMENFGTPNAGLYDQALLFQWVHDHIDKVKGNKDEVSAWGLSAGGSSILHHVIREDGTYDPLFKSFAAFSPGFEWAWNNSAGGKLDMMYRTFSNLTKCGFEYNITCLRGLPPKELSEANQKLFEEHITQTGLFPVGPAVDGRWVKTMPPLAFAQGSYWKEIDSVIVSHTMNESGPFVPRKIVDRESFDAYLAEFLPGGERELQRSLIRQKYDCEKIFNGDFRACAGAIIEHLVITCNTRYLADAFSGKTYAMQYGFPWDTLAFHGADLIPLFTNNFEEAKALLLALPEMTEEAAEAYAGWITNELAPIYPKFFASFGVCGNPNKLLESPPLTWSHVDGNNDALSNVVRVQLGGAEPNNTFHHVSDERNTRSICSFWQDIAEGIAEGSSDQRREEL